MPSAFLTAEWHRLLMLNFPIAPEALQKHVPKGTELDDWEGTTYVSLVAFLSMDPSCTRDLMIKSYSSSAPNNT